MAPIAVDPEASFDLVLKSDQGREKPPTFVFRHLTAREYRGLLSRDRETASVEQIFDDTFALLRSAIVDWRNMTKTDGTRLAFKPAELDAILTLEEATELVRGLMDAGRPGADLAKKSGSPSGSGSAASARGARARRRATRSPRRKRRS